MEDLREEERKERKKKEVTRKNGVFREKLCREIQGDREENRRIRRENEENGGNDGKESCRRQRENGDKPTIDGRVKALERNLIEREKKVRRRSIIIKGIKVEKGEVKDEI